MPSDQTAIPLGGVLAALLDHRGRTPKKLGGDFTSNGVPVLSAKNIKDGHLVATEDIRYVSHEMYDRWMPEKLQVGDVLLTSEAPLGEALYLKDEANYCLGQRLFALRADPEKLDGRFLYYSLRSEGVQQRLHARATGTTAQGIRQSELVKVLLHLPPLPEQCAIGTILGTLDDKIDLNRRMNQTLEKMAQALFKSWFVDFDPVRAKAEGHEPAEIDAEVAALFPNAVQESRLGDVPIGWRVGKVSDLCTTQYGYTASANDEPIGPKFLRVTDMNKQPWVEWNTVPYCSIDEHAHDRYRLSLGDVLVSRMADPGKAAIMEEDHLPAVFASYLIRLKTPTLSTAYYLFYFLRSAQYLDYVEAAKSGSVQANMNAQVITAAELVIPPPAVIEAFAQAVAPLRRKIVANLRESGTLAATRDALLPKLLSGEVRVRKAEKLVAAVG